MYYREASPMVHIGKCALSINNIDDCCMIHIIFPSLNGKSPTSLSLGRTIWKVSLAFSQ